MTDAAEAIDTGAGEEAQTETSEDKAKALGWRPKDQFVGDEARFVDADEFLRRGEEILPIVRATNKKLEESNAKQAAELAEMRKTFADFKVHHSKTEQRAYQRAMSDLEARQAEAVEANDVKAVRAITKEMTDLSTDIKTDAAPANPYASPDHAKALSSWQSDNAWYGSDRIMTLAADDIAVSLEKSGVTGADQLTEVAKRIKAEFPHKFQNERRTAPAAVEGATAVRKTGKGWGDLPADAKAFADRMVKQGLVTRETYAKDYFA